MKNIFLILLLMNSFLFAHPHYFLDSKLEIKEDSIKNIWKFDRLNSRILMFEFDRNRNNKFEENEKKEFIKTHFKKLKNNNYNIFLADEEGEYLIKPENSNIVFENKKVQIIFDINHKLLKETTICLIDEKIYMAYRLEELKSSFNTEIQKSEYDYCVGVYK